MTDYDDRSALVEIIQAAGDAELDDDAGLEPVEAEAPLFGEALASFNLRRIRLALGLSQQQISDKIAEKDSIIRLSQSQIAKIERGERPWRLNEMLALANALGINFLEFFSGKRKIDDPDLKLLAARLAYQQAETAEERAQDEWRQTVKERRLAEEGVLEIAARMGVKDQAAMHILEGRWLHQNYVKEFLGLEADGPQFDLAAVDNRSTESAKWAETEWQRYLRKFQ